MRIIGQVAGHEIIEDVLDKKILLENKLMHLIDFKFEIV